MTVDPHVNYFSDWQTPPEWLYWVGQTFGPNYDDPCPAGWNPNMSSGLVRPWGRSVYVNPPGSNSIVSVKPWWNKMILESMEGRVARVIWCFFNWEGSMSMDPSPWEFEGFMLMPRSRVGFWRDGKAQKSPRNRTIFWLGGLEDFAEPPERCVVVRTGEFSQLT